MSAAAIRREQVEHWLRVRGFTAVARTGTGHRQWRGVGPAGAVRVTVSGHGRRELSKKLAGMLFRQLSRAGFGTTADIRRQVEGS